MAEPYKLSSLTQFSVLSRPKDLELEAWFPKKDAPWSLTVTRPTATNYVVRCPRFAVRYPTTVRWNEPYGASQVIARTAPGFSVEVTSSFRVRVGGEIMQADALDFTELDFTSRPKVALTTAGGTQSAGELIMVNEKAIQWALLCDLVASPGVVLCLLSPECTLRRISPSARPPSSPAPTTITQQTAVSPKERIQGQGATLLPNFKQELRGSNPVRVRNPNTFAVSAGIRAGDKGKNLDVPANGVETVSIPDGKYDIFFVYSDKPDSLFQGDSFTLNGNGVEIQIVKVVNGNYGIRQVK